MAENALPWETPKIQMIMSMFNGKVSSIVYINQVERKVDNEEISR